MRKLLLLFLLSGILPVLSFAQGQNFPSGGGIRFVATISGLACTPGVTSLVELNVNPYTVYYCSATNTWTAFSSGSGSISGCTTTGGVAYENGTSNTLTCEAGLTHPAAGSLAITSGADATSALLLTPHSSTQSVSLADINNGSSTSPQGVFTVRGHGINGGDCDDQGDPCLFHIIANDNSTVGLVYTNAASHTGASATMAFGPDSTIDSMNIGAGNLTNTSYSQYRTDGTSGLIVGPDSGPVEVQTSNSTNVIFHVPVSTTSITTPELLTTTNCSAAGSAANPSVVTCSAATAGQFSCATNASTTTCVVDTSAIAATSEVFIQPAAADTISGVTCNTTADTGLVAPRIASISSGTSFTINLGTFTTNPLCFAYFIVNP